MVLSKIKLFCTATCLLFILVGCTMQLQESTVQLFDTPSITSSQLPSVRFTGTVNSIPSQTVEKTTVPIKTQTPNYTWTPPPKTLTPLPTLSDSDSKALVAELLSNNRGCRYPCWWGITPGVTTWSEANHFLASFVEITPFGSDSLLREYLIGYPLETERGIGGFSVRTQGEKIVYIFVGRATTAYNTLMPQILSNCGVPDTIYLSTFQSSPEGGIPLTIVLYYSKEHFLAIYELTAQAEGEEIVACLSGESPGLFLLSPDEEVTKQRIQDWALGVDPILPLKPLEKVTDLDVSSFTEQFGSPSSENPCLSTGMEFWEVNR